MCYRLFVPCATPAVDCSFAPAEELTTSAIKTSAIRGIKRAICDQYPAIEDYIDDIIPKKDNVMESKG